MLSLLYVSGLAKIQLHFRRGSQSLLRLKTTGTTKVTNKLVEFRDHLREGCLAHGR